LHVGDAKHCVSTMKKSNKAFMVKNIQLTIKLLWFFVVPVVPTVPCVPPIPRNDCFDDFTLYLNAFA
jgi:hypothetical protein